eukprot:Awhi_evm1s2195
MIKNYITVQITLIGSMAMNIIFVNTIWVAKVSFVVAYISISVSIKGTVRS